MRLDEGHAKGFFFKSQEGKKVENQVAFSARVLFFRLTVVCYTP